jgi:hypothetical protein
MGCEKEEWRSWGELNRLRPISKRYQAKYVLFLASLDASGQKGIDGEVELD